MITSRTIKFNQACPPAILAQFRGQWSVEGRDRESYQVTRSTDGRAFYCTCQAGRAGRLCRHVQAVVLDLAQGKHIERVAFWTNQEDAERQHRRALELHTRSRSFWVTYNYGPEVPREPGACIVRVVEDKWSKGLADAYYLKDGRWYRRVIDERRAA